MTGCTASGALRASHIKPWKRCKTSDERLDPDNGLLLTATLDALFDKGLITFTDKGDIQIASRICTSDRERLGLNQQIRLSKLPLSPKQLGYLKVHRQEIYADRPRTVKR